MSIINALYIVPVGPSVEFICKHKTLTAPLGEPSSLPEEWSKAGASGGDDTEIILHPQAIFRDPFRKGGNNVLVMCSGYTPAGEPIPANKRHHAVEIFNNPKVLAEEPWFGVEQRYILWPAGDTRDLSQIVDSHLKACQYAGVNISPVNEQGVPAVGIVAGDHLWIARYILKELAKDARFHVSFGPISIEDCGNGRRAPTSYSTKSMREGCDFEVVKEAITKLEQRHKEHIAAYGEGNGRCQPGMNATAVTTRFAWSWAYHGASIGAQVPLSLVAYLDDVQDPAEGGASVSVQRDNKKRGKWYLKDLRPAANMDPYVVTSMIAETTILWEP